MRRVLEINVEQGWARVEAGVVLDQLNAQLKPLGFFFAPDLSPSNRATIGGMVNTDACGKGSRVYGKTSQHILELRGYKRTYMSSFTRKSGLFSSLKPLISLPAIH